tara:strand:- start:1136 stop:2206 length:1071 start_codon:yes stop_codon:yes gene_type:complete
MVVLYNKKNKEQLINQLDAEQFNRLTISFYKYVSIEKLSELRDKLYYDWSKLNILGRVYLAEEGINAQISLPDFNLELFQDSLKKINTFKHILIKPAVEEGISFYKLKIKIKKEIVAYKVKKDEYDMDKTGTHLEPEEFNDMMDKENAIVVDMRNHYESEVGKFQGALCPDVDCSEELLPETKKILDEHKDDNIMLYCTGGIRCEKASSYLIKHKFKNVFQLKGGIINYAHKIKEEKLTSKFLGKNFVFDERLGERITKDILSTCHQCLIPADQHLNCANDACHLLFIQCDSCSEKYKNCCSEECKNINSLPLEKQRELRKNNPDIAAPLIHHYKDRLKPKLPEMNAKKLAQKKSS